MNLNDSTEGRWLTPDLLGGDITNPQSLNRYAYVLNNPATLTDPSGLDPGDPLCGNLYEWPGGSYEGSAPPTEDCELNSYPFIPPSFPIIGGIIVGGRGGSAAPPGPGAPAPPANRPSMIGNPLTAQVGASSTVVLPWGFQWTFFVGFAIDLHGHIALYGGHGPGVGTGASGSAGIQLGVSNADTVCGLSGPFINASGTLGVEGSGGTVDIFQGKGNGPGGTVSGGTVTIGVAGGASASVARTTTTVDPINGTPCH